MGENGFFIDPHGDILACNGMDEKKSMGNLNQSSWEQIWEGKQAKEVRKIARDCSKNCWMIGSAAPAIWQHPIAPIRWVVNCKLRSILGKDIKKFIKRKVTKDKNGVVNG
jgi:sulfatase maturation enzyme AslB (radical SAM superfamily)